MTDTDPTKDQTETIPINPHTGKPYSPGYTPTGQPIGTPRKFKTVEELQTAINIYFESCWTTITVTKGKGDNQVTTTHKQHTTPYTVTGLALAIGLSRQGLLNYQERADFMDTITCAKQFCEKYAEEQCFVGRNPSGAQFVMQNNYKGWENVKNVNVSGKVDHDHRLGDKPDQEILDRIKNKRIAPPASIPDAEYTEEPKGD